MSALRLLAGKSLLSASGGLRSGHFTVVATRAASTRQRDQDQVFTAVDPSKYRFSHGDSERWNFVDKDAEFRAPSWQKANADWYYGSSRVTREQAERILQREREREEDARREDLIEGAVNGDAEDDDGEEEEI